MHQFIEIKQQLGEVVEHTNELATKYFREDLYQVISNPKNYHHIPDDFKKRLDIYFGFYELTSISLMDVEETGIAIMEAILGMTPNDYKHDLKMKVTDCRISFGRTLFWGEMKTEVFETLLNEARWIDCFTNSISSVYNSLPDKVKDYKKELQMQCV